MFIPTCTVDLIALQLQGTFYPNRLVCHVRNGVAAVGGKAGAYRGPCASFRRHPITSNLTSPVSTPFPINNDHKKSQTMFPTLIRRSIMGKLFGEVSIAPMARIWLLRVRLRANMTPTDVANMSNRMPPKTSLPSSTSPHRQLPPVSSPSSSKRKPTPSPLRPSTKLPIPLLNTTSPIRSLTSIFRRRRRLRTRSGRFWSTLDRREQAKSSRGRTARRRRFASSS